MYKKLKKTFYTLLLAGTFFTGCHVNFGLINPDNDIDEYNDNEIIAITPEGALNIIQSNPDEETIKTIYKMGVHDKKESDKLLNFHNRYWNKVENSKKFKEMQKNWKNISKEKKQKYLQKLINEFCEYCPELEKNGFDRELEITEDLKEGINGRYRNSVSLFPLNLLKINILEPKIVMSLNDDFKGSIKTCRHELSHAVSNLVTLPFQKNTINKKLSKFNFENYYESSGDYFYTYLFQPEEMQANIIGKNDTTALKGKNIFITRLTDDEKEYQKLVNYIISNPSIKKALENDGIVYKHEIKKEFPNSTDLKNKLILSNDKTIKNQTPDSNHKSLKIDFSNSLIINQKIKGKNLSSSVFNNNKLYISNFENSNLEKTNFSNTFFYACVFKESNLNKSNFSNTTFNNTLVTFCNLTNIDISKIKIENKCFFINCKITDTPANRKFIENNKDSFVSTKFVKTIIKSSKTKEAVIKELLNNNQAFKNTINKKQNLIKKTKIIPRF